MLPEGWVLSGASKIASGHGSRLITYKLSWRESERFSELNFLAGEI